MLRLVVNSFAPINRIPPEVLSLIPDYWHEDPTDKDLITLTHVCRSWRTIFTSRPSLWDYFDCGNVDKTRAYVGRSKAAPLEVWLEDTYDSFYSKEAFLLVTPHINRLQYLTIITDGPQEDLISHCFRHAPLLKALHISTTFATSVLSGAFLEGDLPSLHSLRLDGVITQLHWRNVSNLVKFELGRVPVDRIFMTQFLDFFEKAPLLHTILLEDSIPSSSDAPPERIASLPHLKTLRIDAQQAHTILLNHLSIPHATSVVVEFDFGGGTFPISRYLPQPSEKIGTLSCVTSINLVVDAVDKSLRLDGPGGRTSVYAHWVSPGSTPSYVMNPKILQSLDQSILSTTERLSICKGTLLICHVNNSQEFQTLSSMNNLRSLTLTECYNLPFILALNPRKTPSNIVLCPKLEELMLSIEELYSIYITDMLDMAEGRALRGARLSSITIVGPGGVTPGKDVFKLRDYVTRVDYRVQLNDAPLDRELSS